MYFLVRGAAGTGVSCNESCAGAQDLTASKEVDNPSILELLYFRCYTGSVFGAPMNNEAFTRATNIPNEKDVDCKGGVSGEEKL